MNGLEFLKAIRADKELKNILFVMLRAESISDKIELATQEGANDYITKPFKTEKIKTEIEKVILQRSQKKQSKSV